MISSVTWMSLKHDNNSLGGKPVCMTRIMQTVFPEKQNRFHLRIYSGSKWAREQGAD